MECTVKEVGCTGWSDQSRAGEEGTLLRVSHLRNDEPAWRLCAQQPSFSAGLCQNQDSQAALLARTELESQSVAAKEKRKSLCLCNRKSLG